MLLNSHQVTHSDFSFHVEFQHVPHGRPVRLHVYSSSMNVALLRGRGLFDSCLVPLLAVVSRFPGVIIVMLFDDVYHNAVS